MASENANSNAKGKGKKKASKFNPLPGVHAAEETLPWHIEFHHRVGRHAVADADLPAGTLVLIERPFLCVPISKFAAAVCHRCLRTLLPSGEVPPPGNPCLPRYCPRCKEDPALGDLDTKLAALRIKLPEIAGSNSLDPTMLHIITLLDLQRGGIAAGAPPPGADSAGPLPQGAANGPPELRCGVADFDSLTNMWDRKPESWRKKVGPAIRVLHKELSALAASGAIPGYVEPSAVTRLQADAAQLSAHIQTIAGPGASTDTGVGIFPALSVFQHSCAPNSFFITLGSRLFVRTIQDVPKGTALSVSYVSLTEPRALRQASLEGDRHLTCTCPRCSQPLDKSLDRMLEGVLCQTCGTDVLIPVPEGAPNELAAAEFKERVLRERETLAKAAARRKGGRGKKKDAEDGTTVDGSDGENGVKPEEEPDAAIVPEGVMFWRCCGCGAVEPAHNMRQDGPADVSGQAARLMQQAVTFLNLKHPDLMAQGEALLEVVVGGMDGRLPVFHHRVLDAHAPLINLNMRKGEAVKVLHLAIQLWDLDRQLTEGRPTLQQLQCLEAIVDAAEAKASAVNSAVIKRQLEKKVKLAHEQLREVRRVLLGRTT